MTQSALPVVSKRNPKPLILAFGFDKLGFFSPSPDIETDDFVVRFEPDDSSASLDQADGQIIPSGIFEEMEQVAGPLYEKRTIFRSATNDLAEREKQLVKAWKKGAWTCFLLGKLYNGDRDEAE